MGLVVALFDESDVDSFDEVGIGHLLFQIGSLSNTKLIRGSGYGHRLRLVVFAVDEPIGAWHRPFVAGNHTVRSQQAEMLDEPCVRSEERRVGKECRSR